MQVIYKTMRAMLAAALFAGGAHTARAGGLGVMLDTAAAPTGAHVAIPLRVIAGFNDIVSLQGTLAYDSTIIVLDSVAGYGLPSMQPSQFGFLPSKLTFSWDDPSLQGVSRTGGDILFVLHFHVVGTPGQHSPIEGISLPTILEWADISLVPFPLTVVAGGVTVIDTATAVQPAREFAALPRLAPLPASPQARFIWPSGNASSAARITLIALDGRTLAQGTLLPGDQRSIAQLIPGTHAIPDGPCILHIQSGTARHAETIIWTAQP